MIFLLFSYSLNLKFSMNSSVWSNRHFGCPGCASRQINFVHVGNHWFMSAVSFFDIFLTLISFFQLGQFASLKENHRFGFVTSGVWNCCAAVSTSEN